MSETEVKKQKFVIIDTAQQMAANREVAVGKVTRRISHSAVAEQQVDIDLPVQPGRIERIPTELLARHKVIHPTMEDQDVLNSFRLLRLSLQSKLQRVNSSLVVSSVVSGGGASFVSANLAAAFAMDKQCHALLMDCNLGRPTQSKTYDVPEAPGMCEFLRGSENSVKDIIKHSRVPRLSVVPGGQFLEDGVPEDFTGDRFPQLIKEVTGRYEDRITILDCPPILDSAYTKVIAGHCDAVLLVIPYNQVTPGRIDKTVKEFGRDRIIGCIINN